jgi:hypothetical protein
MEEIMYAFDTLSYARKLKEAGVPPKEAEAHAEAAREFVMAELVTKQDLATALDTVMLRLTVRLGLMLAAGLTILATVLKLT